MEDIRRTNPSLYNSYIQNPELLINEFLTEEEHVKFYIKRALKYPVQKGCYFCEIIVSILFYILSFIFLYQIFYSVPIYFDGIQEKQFEVRYWLYLGTSLSLHIIIYQIIIELLVMTMIFIFFTYLLQITSVLIVLAFLLVPFVIQSFCFFLSSCTSMKILTNITGFVFGCLSCIPITKLREINVV